MRRLSARKAKISFEIKRFKDFVSIFVRNKRGMLGLVILFFFIIIAVAAPLITPYSPVFIPGEPLIAHRYGKPVWYKYLPLEIIGMPRGDTSENVEPMRDPHFSTATSLQEAGLELTTNPTGQSVSLQFVSDIGREEEEKEKGAIAIVFNREENEDPLGEVTANLTKVFYYPYKVPPNRFLGQVAVLVNTSEDVPVAVNVVLEKEGGNRKLEWWSQTFNSSGTTWITPEPSIDSTRRSWIMGKFGPDWQLNPAHIMFSETGNYRYSVGITFNDTLSSEGETVEATVYVDDFYIRLFGSAFGLLGTDKDGLDVFTQLVYGARISLIVGLLSAFLSTVIGLFIGLTAGYIGKFVDEILMRFTDLLLVIPDTPLYIVLMAVSTEIIGHPSIWNLILLIAVIGWTGFARMVRSSVLSLRERPFVEAAKAVGAGRFRIIMRHILPNVMNLVYVTLATSVPYAITSEAWLSWLGLYDPYVMTWGRMLHDAQGYEGIRMWWWIVPPGLCIAAISLSFILLGYALDEVLNPKLRKRY